MMNIRDEAHRLGITFHRQKRSKNFIGSTLNNIAGIGPKTIEDLMHHFRTISAIKKASQTDLAAVVGLSKALKIKDFFKDK
jgi:excinuclease ABC subunit C